MIRESSILIFVHLISAPLWEKMNDWERAPYEQEAKIQKAHYKAVGTKFTSQGVPLEEIENEQRAKQEAIEKMETFIERKLQTASLNSGRFDLKFFSNFC